MKFKFSQDDLNRGKLLEPGLWYPTKVMKVRDEIKSMKTPTSGDGKEAINTTTFDCKVIDGQPEAGAMIYVSFNEAYPGFAVPFFQAFGIDVTADDEYDPHALEGRFVDIFVEHREYNNKKYTNPVSFRPHE